VAQKHADPVLINVPVVYMSRDVPGNDFNGGKSITRAHSNGPSYGFAPLKICILVILCWLDTGTNEGDWKADIPG
jgi:hypothetical protein